MLASALDNEYDPKVLYSLTDSSCAVLALPMAEKINIGR